ncbi:hypothetical protein PENSPDRAFT_652060 [Peniophora sp. CONT]|nr:hypothetical protein PENSPDRAFT_652060 [Peniophora sp. CONT]
MASAALIAVLVVLLVLTLVSIEVTMHIMFCRRRRRHRRHIQGVQHKNSTPWSTLGLVSTQRSRVIDITEVPQPPSPSHNRPRPGHDAYQQLDGPVVSAGIGTLNPYTPPPLAPTLPRLHLPAPLATWPNEKERLDTSSLVATTRPPSYSQVETSPLSPRYTLVVRGHWGAPAAASSPTSPTAPPVRPMSFNRSQPGASPSDSIARPYSQIDVSSQATASTAPRAANSTQDT